MKEIAYELGRVVILAPPQEITPLEHFDPHQSFSAISKRYSFQGTPDLSLPVEQVQKEGYRFRMGKVPGAIKGEKASAAITDFAIFADGFVIDSNTTEEGEIFAADISKWGKEALGLRDFNPSHRKTYFSQVAVQFEPAANKLINKFDDISTLLSNLIMKTYRLNTVVELQGVRFDYDKLSTPSLYNLVQFVIERKAGHKYEDGILWSQAPLRTADHIQVLKSIETLLSK